MAKRGRFFLRNLMTDVIFPEAGLGRSTARPKNAAHGSGAARWPAASLIYVLAGLTFLYSFLRYSGAIDDQARQIADLSGRLANVAARQAPTDPLDLDLALDAMTAGRCRPRPKCPIR